MLAWKWAAALFPSAESGRYDAIDTDDPEAEIWMTDVLDKKNPANGPARESAAAARSSRQDQGESGHGHAGSAADPQRQAVLRPIGRSGLSDESAERLYEAIVEGRIKLGSRISEAGLSRDLGISRGPLREAQRQLEQQGLLNFIPRRGFFVRELTQSQIDDLSRVRLLIEVYAAREAALKADQEALERIASWRTGNTPEYCESLDTSSFVEHDLDLHRQIVAATGNEALIGAFDSLIGRIRLVLALITFSFAEGRRILDTHDVLIDALLARDPDAAAAAMEHHLTAGRSNMAGRLSQLSKTGVKKAATAHSRTPMTKDH